MKKVYKILSFLCLLIFPITTASVGMAYDTVDSPTNGKDIRYSIKKGKENLLEIFSDGLDYRFLGDLIENNEDFKDFIVIRNLANQGLQTFRSLPVIFGDYKKWNSFAIKNREHLEGVKTKDFIEKNVFGPITVHHLNSLDKSTNFDKTLVNTVNFNRKNLNGDLFVGDKKVVEGIDPKLNTINWQQAKDKLTNKGWSFKKSFSDSLIYNYLKTFPKKASEKDKPARILIQDMISHGHYYDKPNYQSVFKKLSVKDNYVSLVNYWKNYFESLKKIKGDKTDGEESAYDNSMIVIFGDHSNHFVKNGLRKKGYALQKENSVLLIKYPHFSNANKKPIYLNNISASGADIKHIINNYFTNKQNYNNNNSQNPIQNSLFNFLNTNKNFALNKIMINDEGNEMQFNNKHELINLGRSKHADDPKFDPSNYKKYWGWT